VCAYGVGKPLPDGLSFAGELRPLSGVEFLHDLTYATDTGRVSDQLIFDRVFHLIDRARRFIVIDMFLLNDEHGGDREYPALSRTLVDRLIESRLRVPGIEITLITDEINTFYGSYQPELLSELEDAGVNVIITDLTRLRDSNPSYSSLWRTYVRWFGTGGPALFPHPLTSRGRKVTARSYLRMLNFKANHRKLIVTEQGCLITSANPHDASGFHSNIAFAATGGICADMLESERAVARFSGASIPTLAVNDGEPGGPERARLLTEGEIRQGLLEAIRSTESGDSIDVAMFYFSDRRIVRALLEASALGVNVRVILDPNKDAFGREKNGIPNRQVAHELTTRSEERVNVRWYDTQGEQFHTKLVIVKKAETVRIFGGSANLTRRNLGDYNLEADLEIVAPREATVAGEVARYFDRIWTNDGGRHTIEYRAYEDPSHLKRLVYRLQEFTGWCSY